MAETRSPAAGSRPSPAPAVAREAFAGLKRGDAANLAAGVAFKIFLSLFPALLAAVAVWSLVTDPAALDGLLERLRGVLPGAAVELLQQPLEELAVGGGGAAGATAVVGVVGGLWAASSAAVTLMRALNRAEEVLESRNLLVQRLVAVAITVGLFVALAALVALLVFGPQIQQALVEGGAEGTGLSALLTTARLLAAVGVLVLLFGFVYRLGPDRPAPAWRALAPGAVVGVVCWLAVSAGFAFYARTAGDYGAAYGSIAGVIVTLLWLQLSMLALIGGAEVNAAWARVRRRRSR